MKARLCALAAVATMGVPVATPARADPTMPVLATVVVPAAATSANSMSIAFDGEVFYFLDGSTLLRTKIAGTAGGSFTATSLPALPLPLAPKRIYYDARHRAILLEERDLKTLARFDLRTLGVTATVQAPENGAGQTYDWSTDFLYTLGYTKGGTGHPDDAEMLVTRDWQGRRQSSCPTRVYGEAAIAASGDGTVYLQSEDDQTVTRVAPRCTESASYVHRTVAESQSEDDAIVCDGVTFGRPAIWLRDSATATMSAYGLPEGRCVLPTRLSLRVAGGRACATLTRYELPTPLPNLPVAMLGQTPLTDESGRACLDVTAAPGQHTVRAAFAGTEAWAPSTASASYGIAPPPVAAVRPPPVQSGAPARVAVVHAAPPPAPAGAPTPVVAPHVAVAQAAQPAYGTASATQSIPVGAVVPQAEEQAQLAYADERRREGPPRQLYAVSMLMALAAALANRYRTATLR